MEETHSIYLNDMFSGYLYVCIEMLYREYSDVSMMFVSSICAIPMIALNDVFSYEMDFLLQVIICSSFVTLVEYIAGRYIVNQQLQIWDYSNLPLNLHGQICLYFYFAWMLLSVIVILRLSGIWRIETILQDFWTLVDKGLMS